MNHILDIIKDSNTKNFFNFRNGICLQMNFLKVFFILIIKNIFSIETILVHGPFFLDDQTETIIEMPNNCQDLSTFEMINLKNFKYFYT